MRRVSCKGMILLPLLGLFSGLLNGLLGTGGGVVIVYGMQHFFKCRGLDRRGVFVTAIAVMLPLSLLSAQHYLRAGHFEGARPLFLLLPGALGGAAGALLQQRLSVRLLQRIFAGLVLLSGILMVV